MLTVYVDDFKLAGPGNNLAQGWKLIRSCLDVEQPGPIGPYLGCKHEMSTPTVDGSEVRVMTYNMEEYLEAIVNDYQQLASQIMGKEFKFKEAKTPFLEDDHKSSPARAPVPYDSDTPVCPWCCIPVTNLGNPKANIPPKPAKAGSGAQPDADPSQDELQPLQRPHL